MQVWLLHLLSDRYRWGDGYAAIGPGRAGAASAVQKAQNLRSQDPPAGFPSHRRALRPSLQRHAHDIFADHNSRLPGIDVGAERDRRRVSQVVRATPRDGRIGYRANPLAVPLREKVDGHYLAADAGAYLLQLR